MADDHIQVCLIDITRVSRKLTQWACMCVCSYVRAFLQERRVAIPPNLLTDTKSTELDSEAAVVFWSSQDDTISCRSNPSLLAPIQDLGPYAQRLSFTASNIGKVKIFSSISESLKNTPTFVCPCMCVE